METLTILLLLLAMGLFILTSFRKKQELVFLGLLLGVFSLMAALTDETIGGAISFFVILDVFMIMISIVRILFMDGDE